MSNPTMAELSPEPPSGSSDRKTWVKWLRRVTAGSALILSLCLITGYFIITSSGVLEKLIMDGFNKASNGTLSLKISRASLFRGFIFEDIRILSGPDFDRKPLFEMKKFSLIYFLPGFWTGDFGLHEVGIYQPRVNLIQKKNVWNAATLMKPGEKKEPEPEKKEVAKDDSPTPAEISLPFSIRLFFKFVLEDLAITVDGDDKSNSNPITFELKDFTFRTHILSEKFSSIPLGPGIVRLFETILIQLNPQQKIRLNLATKDAATKKDLNLHWLLAYDGSSDVPKFNSQLLVGESRIPLQYRGRHLLPFDVNVNYRLNYDPIKDVLLLTNFTVQMLGDTWLNLTGRVENVTGLNKKPMLIDIALDKSDINLNHLYPLAAKITGKTYPSFGGGISLAPLSVKGTMDNLAIKGEVGISSLRLIPPSPRISIPFFKLSYDTVLNATAAEPLKKVRTASVNWRGSMNGAQLKGDIFFDPEKKTDIAITVKNFNPSPFSGGQASGTFDVGLFVQGDKINNLKLKTTVNAPDLIYTLDRGRSGQNRLAIRVDGRISAPSTASMMASRNIRVSMSRIYFAIQNKNRQDAVWLDSTLNVNMANAASMDIQYVMKEMGLNFQALHPTVTEALRESLAPVKTMFEKNIVLYGETGIKKRGAAMNLDHVTKFSIYDADIHDLKLEAKVAMKPGLIEIPEVKMTGLHNALNLNINGEVREGRAAVTDDKGRTRSGKVMKPDVRLSLSFGKDKKERIFQKNQIQGSIGLNARYHNDLAEGSLNINDFYFDNGELLKVNKMNMKFPFLFNAKLRKALNLTAANKERIIKNYNFSKPFNLTIDSVEIPHPTKPKEEKTAFKLIYPQGKYPGFGARLEFKDNVFEMQTMQIFLLNGLVSAQDVLFNLGTINPKYMEFIAQIQIKDIDLKQLIPPDKAEAIRDGKLSMDMFALGNRLDQPVDNLRGYISIYKIGSEFGKQALKVVKPDSNGVIDFVVDNSIVVKKIDLDLKEGLIYTKIIYKKEIFGNFISPEGDFIEQSRIPISQFLNNVEKEASVYSGTEKSAKKKSAGET